MSPTHFSIVHNPVTMDCKYSLDFKFLFDSLSGANGRIHLDTLARYWPNNDKLPAYLPKDLVPYWRASTAQDRTLTWEGFSRGLEGGIKADKSSTQLTTNKLTIVSTQEMEAKLLQSSKAQLTESLARTRKEMYKMSTNVTTASPRKSMNRHRSSSHDPLQSKNYDEREKATLQQVEALLRDKLKGTETSSLINEVLQQLHNILHTSKAAATSTNPYATIRRGGSHPKEKRYYSQISYPPQPIRHHYSQLPMRSVSLGSNHSIFDSSNTDPLPPYSASIPSQTKHTLSMMNLATGNISHEEKLRPQSTATHHLSSPNIHKPYTETELKQIDAMSRRPNKEMRHHTSHQQQCKQIKELQDQKDVLIRYIFEHQAHHNPADDSIISEDIN